MRKINDLTGKTLGRWTVISRDCHRLGRQFWNCVCSCGNSRSVYQNSLVRGDSKSCGCLKIEMTSTRSITHGMSNSKEYSSWLALRQRCTHKSQIGYKDYGGRGIKVCSRWLNSFENFLSDMGPCPSDGHSIDRIKVNGNYEPNNCRWASTYEQSTNTRKTLFLTVSGVTKPLMTWCKEIGISYIAARERFHKPGYTPEMVLSTVRFKTGPKMHLKVTP